MTEDLDRFKNSILEIKTTIASLRKLTANTQDEGISLLQIRINAMISYLMSLLVVIASKVNGKDISPIVPNLVNQRIVLEKTKPLEIKLKYQIDKLVKQTQNIQPEFEELKEVDVLQFKPNIKEFTKDQEGKTDGIYKPPRIQPMAYNEKKSLTDKQREKAKASRLLRDLHDQFDQRPEELDAEGIGYSSKLGSKEDDYFKEREAFEEENFIRKSYTRKEKSMKKAIEKQGGLIRFKNEFDELKSDFESVKDIIGNSSKKRSFEDHETSADAIKANGKKRMSQKGKDEFTKSKKILKLKKRK